MIFFIDIAGDKTAAHRFNEFRGELNFSFTMAKKTFVGKIK